MCYFLLYLCTVRQIFRYDQFMGIGLPSSLFGKNLLRCTPMLQILRTPTYDGRVPSGFSPPEWGEMEEASASAATVAMTLEYELDISQGEMIFRSTD